MLLRRYHDKRRELAQKQQSKTKRYLNDKTVKELRELARAKGVDNYYDMNKSELIDALKE